MAWAAALGGIGQAAGGITDAVGGRYLQAQFDVSQSTKAWHRYLYARATQYQTAVNDLRAAGLNPMLAYTQGGAGAAMPPSARAPGGDDDIGGEISKGISSARELMGMKHVIGKLKADRRRADAEASSAESEAEVNSYMRDARMKLGDISVEQARQMVASTIASRKYVNAQELRQELEVRLGKLNLNEMQAQSEYYSTPEGRDAVKANRAIQNYLPFLSGAGHLRGLFR